VMFLIGLLFILMGAIGAWLLARKKLASSRGYLKFLLFAVPLPYLANTTGWIAAEVGRQPWAVYKVLRTSEAVSAVVPAGNIVVSLVLLTAVYILIAVGGLAAIFRRVRSGPGGGPDEAGKGAY